MNGKAEDPRGKYRHKIHTCDRHHDLTILLKSAYKKICNTCFATLKKSYFNVIAGCVLECHYLHNLTRGFVGQINELQARIQDQEQAILNLQAEITEVKNNGKNQKHPTQQPARQTVPHPAPKDKDRPPSDPKIIRTEGHVAKVANSLSHLLDLQIARILKSWKEKKDRT